MLRYVSGQAPSNYPQVKGRKEATKRLSPKIGEVLTASLPALRILSKVVGIDPELIVDKRQYMLGCTREGQEGIIFLRELESIAARICSFAARWFSEGQAQSFPPAK